MNILVIILYWYPYEGPLMPIYGTIFKELMLRGHNITIVTSFPHYRKGHSEIWKQYRGKFFEITEWEGAKLIRSYVYAPVFRNGEKGLIYRVLNFISFNLSSIYTAIFFSGKANLIFAPSSPPLTNALISFIVSRIKRCPMVYNVQDLYPEMAIEMGLIKDRWLLKGLKVLERLIYRLSDSILTISESMKDIIEDQGVPFQKVEVIENFIDTEFITPNSKSNAFSRIYGLTDDFVVMYAGNIGIPHGVEVLVKAAEILRNEAVIKFCFVGRGENKESIELMARDKKLSNIIFIPSQPEKMVPLIWGASSVGVVTYRKGLADFSVPSKLLAMMCAARPVIASLDENSEPARIIERSKCGVVIPPEDVTALCEAIIDMKNAPENAREMGLNGRRYAKKHFQRQVISDRYEKLFLSLAKSKQI